MNLKKRPPDAEALAQENDDLRERIRDLERCLGARGYRFPPEWNLSRTETKLLGIMVRSRIAERDKLHAILWGDDPNGGPDLRVLDVHVAHIRRKLRNGNAPFTIKNVHSVGYYIDPEQRAALALYRTGDAQ